MESDRRVIQLRQELEFPRSNLFLSRCAASDSGCLSSQPSYDQIAQFVQSMSILRIGEDAETRLGVRYM